MQYKLLLLLFIPIFLFSQITEDLSDDPPSIIKKLYVKGAFVFGPGFEKVKVGEKYYENSDRDPQDINIMPGGGFGVEAAVGYDLTKVLSAEISIGMGNSGASDGKESKASFQKTLFRASILYKIPLEKKYKPYIGGGLSSVVSAKYLEDTQGIESEVTYTKPGGFHILGGAEWKAPQSSWYWYGELRLHILGEIQAEEASVADWILEEIGIDKMNANGLQFCFGIGYYIR